MQPSCAMTESDDSTLNVELRGNWCIGQELPSSDEVSARLQQGFKRLVIDGDGVAKWDSSYLVFLSKTIREGREHELEVDYGQLEEGVKRLLELAFAVPEKDTQRGAHSDSFVTDVGKRVIATVDETREMVTFVGEATLALWRFVRRKARFRRSDLLLAIQESGSEALGIVSLISFLIGLILAFMGAVQLELFGAEIFVADLVVIGMAREMAPIMTGIVMAGRTGASYAAQLGTMTVNEEVDSLRTLGFSPMDFLVLPRMLALMFMMPLLTLYSNVLGILGGFLVGVAMLGITPTQYWNETVEAAGLDDFAIGFFKAVVIGVLVAIAGCMRGMQSGRSASAVGLAATSAVVTGIVSIIVFDAVIAVVTQTLGI